MKQIRILKAKEQPYKIDASKVSEVSLIDIPLVDNKGKSRSLSELKGQVVLLDFHVFATDNSTERIMMILTSISGRLRQLLCLGFAFVIMMA